MPHPYIVTGDDRTLNEHRLLLITAVFPPDPRSGSLRWQKLSHFIVERGWGLDVIATDPADIEFADPKRIEDLPPGIRVYGVRVPQLRTQRVIISAWRFVRRVSGVFRSRRTATPQVEETLTQHAAVARSDEPESLGRSEITWSISSFQNLVRAFHAWTEYAQWGSWARRAAALAKQVIEPGIHQAIITSGPPHMAHEAGRLASRASGLPLVLDMRDPWSLVQRLHNDLASPLWYWFAERYEGRAVGQASIVAMNTEPSRRMMQRRYHNARERFITVMNGCDDEPLPPSRHGKKFLLAYTGAIYLDRDPTLLFRAAAGVVRELSLTPDEFGLEFMGHVASYGSRTVMDMAKDEGLDGYLTLVGRSPRHIVMDLLARATMLVSLPQDSDTAIPAKIFEYVQFDAWLLALATPDSAVALLLQNTGAEVVQPDDLDGMTTVIRKHVVEYRNGIRPTRPVRDDRFSRRTQAQRLLNAIAAIVRTEPAAREPASLSTLVTR